VYTVVHNRQKMIQILGKYLTPALLLCLSAVIVQGVLWPAPISSFTAPKGMFVEGLLEGYNTMDLIAAFFFSASLIPAYCSEKEIMGEHLRFVLTADIIRLSRLAAVYIGLVYVAALHGPGLASVPKEQLLAVLARMTLGPQLGVIAAIAICLACFTTSVALTSVYADFLSLRVAGSKTRLALSIYVTLGASFGMSLMGLTGITAVTAPVLQVCYPILLGILFIHACQYRKTDRI